MKPTTTKEGMLREERNGTTEQPPTATIGYLKRFAVNDGLCHIVMIEALPDHMSAEVLAVRFVVAVSQAFADVRDDLFITHRRDPLAVRGVWQAIHCDPEEEYSHA